MIVIGRVVTLSREKWLKTILAADVYRKKLLAIFAQEIGKQLQIRCGRHNHGMFPVLVTAGDPMLAEVSYSVSPSNMKKSRFFAGTWLASA